MLCLNWLIHYILYVLNLNEIIPKYMHIILVIDDWILTTFITVSTIF